MMIKFTLAVLFVGLVSIFAVVPLYAQDDVAGRSISIDSSLKAGFEALSIGKYATARQRFEDAMAAFEKRPEASEWLFTKFGLPDEDPGDINSKEDGVRSITRYRHSMGTKQALIEFAAFSAQLEGNVKLAKKYFGDVYKLQGPLWGTSWKIFIPPTQALFHLSVPQEKTENYGRYLFLSGQLLWDSHEEKGKLLMEQAQKLVPKDSEIAAQLGSVYMILHDPDKARPLSELSLSIDPKQPHVLIDLATAEWLLGSFDEAAKHATIASTLDNELPGPFLILALIAIQRNDFKSAEEATTVALRLSSGHPFYKTIQAAILEARGDHNAADKLVMEAWKGKIPEIKQFENWYLKHKPLLLVTEILSRRK